MPKSWRPRKDNRCRGRLFPIIQYRFLVSQLRSRPFPKQKSPRPFAKRGDFLIRLRKGKRGAKWGEPARLPKIRKIRGGTVELGSLFRSRDYIPRRRNEYIPATRR
jgi:hypothetical protein